MHLGRLIVPVLPMVVFSQTSHAIRLKLAQQIPTNNYNRKLATAGSGQCAFSRRSTSKNCAATGFKFGARQRIATAKAKASCLMKSCGRKPAGSRNIGGP